MLNNGNIGAANCRKAVIQMADSSCMHPRRVRGNR